MKLNSFEHRREPVEGKSCLGAPLKEKASYLGASDQFIALVCSRAGHKAQLPLQVHPDHQNHHFGGLGVRDVSGGWGVNKGV